MLSFKISPKEFLSNLSSKKSASSNQLVHFYQTDKMNHVTDYVSFFSILLLTDIWGFIRYICFPWGLGDGFPYGLVLIAHSLYFCNLLNIYLGIR